MKLYAIRDTSFKMFEYFVVDAETEEEAFHKYAEKIGWEFNFLKEYVTVTEIDPSEPVLIASVSL